MSSKGARAFVILSEAKDLWGTEPLRFLGQRTASE